MEFLLAQPIDSVFKFWKDSCRSFILQKAVAFRGVSYLFSLLIVLQALKALILERMGKSDEALSVCLSAKELLVTNDSVLMDELTLSTLQIVFQRLDHCQCIFTSRYLKKKIFSDFPTSNIYICITSGFGYQLLRVCLWKISKQFGNHDGAFQLLCSRVLICQAAAGQIFWIITLCFSN